MITILDGTYIGILTQTERQILDDLVTGNLATLDIDTHGRQPVYHYKSNIVSPIKKVA